MTAQPAGTFAEPRPSDVTWTHLIYALHASASASVLRAPRSLSRLSCRIAFHRGGDPELREAERRAGKRCSSRTSAGRFARSGSRCSGCAGVAAVAALDARADRFVTLWIAAVVIGLWVLYRVVRGG